MPRREPVPPLHERAEPTLIQKRPGRWTARFRWNGQTKDRALGLTVDPTPKDAPPPQRIQKLALRKYTRPYLAGDWSPFEAEPERPRRGPTVAEATATFLRRYDAPKTREAYETVLRHFDESLEPHTLVAEVTSDDVRAFVYRTTSLQKGRGGRPSERPVTRATQRHAWRHLRAFLNWCRREGMIETNPIERVDPPRVEDRQMPLILPEQMGRILQAADAALPPFLALAYRVAVGAGLRRDEIRYLQAGDIDLDYNYLVVRSKTVGGVEVRTKGRTDRRVPLNPLSRASLEAALERCDAPDDLLFGDKGPRGNLRVATKDRHSKALVRLLREENVHLPRALHSLRGHYITYMLLLDWPVPLVQALVDHKDPNVTYGYLRDVNSLLFGDARVRFREAALALGFEAYHGAGLSVPLG